MAVSIKPTQTTASFIFLKYSALYDREKLYTLNYNPGDSGVGRSNIELDERSDIPITDIRSLQQTLPWETSGIATKTISPVLPEEGFRNEQEIEDCYYPEIERVLQKTFGPSKIVLLEHRVRRRHVAFPIATGQDYEESQPTSIVHVDYTESSAMDAVERFAKLNPKDFSRIIAVNVWKPLHGPLRDWPLALCDASTIDPNEDLVAADIVERHGFTENSRVYYNPKQQWYYLSEQDASEILIFRQYDSKAGLNPVPHSGFQVSGLDASTRRRESIEVRALMFYG